MGGLTIGITQIEFAPMEELLSFRGRGPNGDKVEMQGIEGESLRNPFRVLEVQGSWATRTFLRPMIFENHDQSNSLYIFGGWQNTREARECRAGAEGRPPMHMLEVDFGSGKGGEGGSSLAPVPTSATLQ